jgi:hypothetical protein
MQPEKRSGGAELNNWDDVQSALGERIDTKALMRRGDAAMREATNKIAATCRIIGDITAERQNRARQPQLRRGTGIISARRPQRRSLARARQRRRSARPCSTTAANHQPTMAPARPRRFTWSAPSRRRWPSPAVHDGQLVAPITSAESSGRPAITPLD